MFKGWLKAHPNPERSMCAACNIVLNAGKSELEKHATSIKHQRRMVEYRQQHPVKFDYSQESQGIILVDAEERDDKINTSFIQRHGVYLKCLSINSDYQRLFQYITTNSYTLTKKLFLLCLYLYFLYKYHLK